MDALLRFGRQCASRLHHPSADHVPQRPRDHPPENIYYVMIPPPHGRNAHARHQRQHCPEQPPPVSPCAPQCRDRPCHVLGRKRRASNAPKLFDEIDRRRERPALQRAVPRPRHRKPGALDGKEDRDQIPDRVSRGRIRHYRPISAPILPVIQDPAQRQQIHEVSEICKLHEIVPRRRCELFQPHRRLHARQPVIGGDQLRVLPAGRDQVYELSQFLKTKQEIQVRIPVPPEVPELRRKRGASPLRALRNSGLYKAQNQDHRRNQRLHTNQHHGMRKIFRKHRNQRTRCRQISKRHPFECAARRPRCRRFLREQRRDAFFLRFETSRTLLTSRGIDFRTSLLRGSPESPVPSGNSMRCARKKPSARQSLRAALLSLRLLGVLCVSALASLFLPNSSPATPACAQSSQDHLKGLLPPAGQPPPSTTDPSSCRHTRSIAPGRAASPEPAASLRALSLPQTWPRPKPVPSTCRPFLQAASQTLESSR